MFKIREKLLSWQKIWKIFCRHIATDIEEQLVNQGEVPPEGISRTYQTNETNENHATEPLTVGYGTGRMVKNGTGKELSISLKL